MNEKCFEILDATYKNNLMPIWVYNQQNKLVHHTLQCLSPEKFSTYLLTNIYEPNNRVFYIKRTKQEIYYQINFTKNNEPHYLIAGPMLLKSIHHISDVKQVSFATQLATNDLAIFMEHLPIVSLKNYISALELHLTLLTDTHITYEEVHNYSLEEKDNQLNEQFLFQLFESKNEIRNHTPYSHETAILNCVTEGDVEKLEATYRTLPQTVYGNMSSNPARQLFYGSIANTTLTTRYAIEGGMDEEEAFTLSDVYIRKMERTTDLYELHTLNEKMALDFTSRVAKMKEIYMPSYSNSIKQCIKYMKMNLHQKITLSDLSNVCHLTPKYLSSLFMKETGMKFSEYLENLRISEAKNLLKFSTYSYIEITQLLAFHSQSYFIQIFKKRVGMTPKEYRKQPTLKSN